MEVEEKQRLDPGSRGKALTPTSPSVTPLSMTQPNCGAPDCTIKAHAAILSKDPALSAGSLSACAIRAVATLALPALFCASYTPLPVSLHLNLTVITSCLSSAAEKATFVLITNTITEWAAWGGGPPCAVLRGGPTCLSLKGESFLFFPPCLFLDKDK